jgi:small subunit ribosomal protein S17
MLNMTDPGTENQTAPTAANAARPLRKERIGRVVSARMTKTIVVRVERRFTHPRFKKVVRTFKKFYAHDEQSQAREGDLVRIVETRPISRLKRWRLVEVLERSRGAEALAA